jgi:SAM-dependent methyltransferase
VSWSPPTDIRATQRFYEEYWPRNLPDHRATGAHIRAIVPNRRYRRALDAGCGTGVCSLALADLANEVLSVDLSLACARTAEALARENASFAVRVCQGSVLDLPFRDGHFDLVFSWGVIHHTPSPERALDELVRVLEPGGTLVLAVYLRTALTPLHETIRQVCRRLPNTVRPVLSHGVAEVVRLAERCGFDTNARDDNPRIESQVEDWYFVPEKHFFGVEELGRMFRQRGLSYEVVVPHTGRFRSSSNFVVRGSSPHEQVRGGQE